MRMAWRAGVDLQVLPTAWMRPADLVNWGESVTVEHLARLRQRLADMCEALAGHHRTQ